MGKTYLSINPDTAEWIKKQPLFFVASAPLAGKHVNVSPKGHPARSFAILDPNTIAYLDATGSGCETISHIYENGRVTVMFCSFGVSPMILKLYCTGKVFEKGDKGFYQLIKRMGENIELPGSRAVILLHVWKVQTSCGFGVPLAEKPVTTSGDYEASTPSGGFSHRGTMDKWSNHMLEKNAMEDWHKTWNYKSLDGLTGLRSARKARGQWLMLEDFMATVRRFRHQWDALLLGALMTAALVWALHTSDLLILEARSQQY